ncbi:LysR family transcriptional regulator [Novosphingobium album (ex Hu et al. 2023)]|uniref:LysR family transcriptional regulator n=1 Tax=Novosphingobium album (ex Hu et al. 2023) TaxID=2930093 RepID=A0ABT0B476_9SPHN|nr:LysR family transcriptional regulator [Novosphingobium album (ex Hu et al. 2023)]MCJ2179679.1 LysR family transcriptional regulator [Novosphingobium album (ex Hu et al. 2023)]
MSLLRSALIYFDQAVKDRSIRKAADNLNITSSAISRQLQILEEELGVELFVRMPRGIRPTAAGESLLAYVRRWNRDSEQLDREIAQLKGGVRGTIRIAAAESLIEEIVPRAMARLSERFPLVDFTLISGDNYHMRNTLLAREADVVCAFDVTDSGPTRVVATMEAPMGVVLPVDHALSHQEQISLADCVRYPIVALPADWLVHSRIGDLFDRSRAPLRIVARVERVGMLKSLVEAGIGIAFLSRVGLARDIDKRRLVWRPLVPGAAAPGVVSVLVPRGQVPAAHVSAFVDVLRDELHSHLR